MKIGIIGAGISGLTVAWNMIKAGHTVEIIEKEHEAGGIARGFKEPEWNDSIEFFYHHWFTKDKALLSLINELGLSDDVVFRTPKTVMYYKGSFYPFDSIPAALLYPGLGFGINKIRFGFVGLYLRMTKNWQKLEKVTAKEWMTKYAGSFVYQTMWEPMMIGKFGEAYADRVSMAWLWARIYSRTIRLGTFNGGMQSFFDQFAKKLSDRDVTFRFRETAKKVEHLATGGLRVHTDQKDSVYDRVIVATSPQSMLSLSDELPQDYQTQLSSLKHIGAVVTAVTLKKPLSPQGYYWYNLPKSEGFPCLALVEHTNFVPASHYNNETILYAGDYLENGHPYFSLSAEEMTKKLIPGFKMINPEFSENWIIRSYKFETNYAQPIPFVNQSKAIPPFSTSVEGLYFISMSQVYPWDRGMNFAVDAANNLSRAIS